MREVVQRGLYYDELETGVVYRHRPGRTLTEADDVVFSTLTMNHQALHLDAAWAATQPFGQRLVNSMMTLSTLVGLSVGQITQGTIVANLGFREVEFPKPLFHGDTLYAETEVVEKRLSASRVGQGVVTLEHRGLNQDGVLVARAVRTALFWTRTAHEAASVPDGARSPGAVAQPEGVGSPEPAEPGVVGHPEPAQPGVAGQAGPDVPTRPGFGTEEEGTHHEPVLNRGDEESAW